VKDWPFCPSAQVLSVAFMITVQDFVTRVNVQITGLSFEFVQGELVPLSS
jgi:hypothetical protein